MLWRREQRSGFLSKKYNFENLPPLLSNSLNPGTIRFWLNLAKYAKDKKPSTDGCCNVVLHVGLDGIYGVEISGWGEVYRAPEILNLERKLR